MPTSEHKLSWGTVVGGHIQLPLRVSPLCPMRTFPDGDKCPLSISSRWHANRDAIISGAVL